MASICTNNIVRVVTFLCSLHCTRYSRVEQAETDCYVLLYYALLSYVLCYVADVLCAVLHAHGPGAGGAQAATC